MPDETTKPEVTKVEVPEETAVEPTGPPTVTLDDGRVITPPVGPTVEQEEAKPKRSRKQG